MAPSESRFDWTSLTLGDLCQAQANSQDWHFGITQEDVEQTWFLWWVDDTAICQMDPQRFNFASLLVDVASQCQVSNAKGVTLSGASTSSRFSDRQHMGSWKRDPVSSTKLTNFGQLTRWQSSQALHKAKLHEEQTGTWRHAPSWPSRTRKNCARRASLWHSCQWELRSKLPLCQTSSPLHCRSPQNDHHEVDGISGERTTKHPSFEGGKTHMASKHDYHCCPWICATLCQYQPPCWLWWCCKHQSCIWHSQ